MEYTALNGISLSCPLLQILRGKEAERISELEVEKTAEKQCLLDCCSHGLLAALAACTDLHKIKLAHTPAQRAWGGISLKTTWESTNNS